MWRVIDQGQRRWQVSVAAERRSNSSHWSLVFCFRTAGQRAVWAMLPNPFPSKAAVYKQADHMSNEAILELLAQTLGDNLPH
jgi:hypothetical protein